MTKTVNEKSLRNVNEKSLRNINEKVQPSDEELMARFQDGDNYAFDLIVRRYKEQLLNFVYRFIGDQVESEDVVQETFFRVYKNKNYYKEVAKLSTWIFTIASNLAKTELRKRKRHRVFSLNQESPVERELQLPDHESNPEREANTVVTEKIIKKAISNLPPKFRQVIILRDIQEFPYEEISSIIKVPLGTVKSRVNRARLRLQDDLKFLLNEMNGSII